MTRSARRRTRLVGVGVMALVGLVLAGALIAPAAFAEDTVPPPQDPRTDGVSVVWADSGQIYLSRVDPWQPARVPTLPGEQGTFANASKPDVDGDLIAWLESADCNDCDGNVRVLDRVTNRDVTLGVVPPNTSGPRLSGDYVVWLGKGPNAAEASGALATSVFIQNVRHPAASPIELPSVSGNWISDLTINDDDLCWNEAGHIYTASLVERVPRLVAEVTGTATCSVVDTTAFIAFDSGSDFDPVTTIESIDLRTNLRRVLAEGPFLAVQNDNGFPFWLVYEPRMLRGYDLGADRIVQLEVDDGRSQVHAEGGTVVRVWEYDVVTHAITGLPDASDPRWWEQRSKFLFGVLALAVFVAGALLYFNRVPARVPVTASPYRGTGAVPLPVEAPPDVAVRWAGLAGVVGGVLTIGLGVVAAARPFTFTSGHEDEFNPTLGFQERLVMAIVLVLLATVVTGLHARQAARAGATGWVGYALTLLGIGLLAATLLELRAGRGGVLLGVLLLGVGLMTLGSATIDAEAPVRWRPATLLIGLITLIALPLLALSSNFGGTFAFAPFLVAIGLCAILLGYSVATVRPADAVG